MGEISTTLREYHFYIYLREREWRFGVKKSFSYKRVNFRWLEVDF